jgi:hypothetical protein
MMFSVAPLLLSCASAPPPQASPALLSPAPVVETWDFDAAPGKLIHTRSYRIFTTESDPVLLDALPPFIERALDHYVSDLGPLPRSTLKLDTFLLADRDQWAKLTQQVMGDGAGPYLRIQRGGFASGGRALLFSIGLRDTLAIAAHEGWHQYTQRTFKDELPVWLEEGVATYMEGLTPDALDPARTSFAPWANAERYDQLVSAAKQWQLISLERLLDMHPQSLLSSSTDAALTYYAQVWALLHFLHEGENGKYREGLSRALADAAAGRVAGTIEARLGSGSSKLLAHERRGPELFKTYFNADLTVAATEYDNFVTTIVRGSKDRIMSGQSPISP